MLSRPLRFCIGSLLAAGATLLAGCGMGYSLQASEWGPKIQEAATKLQEVQVMASKPAAFFGAPASQKAALAKLDEVDAMLTAIESEYPDSPPSYHDYLEEGINEMQAAIVVGREGIEKKNLAKLEQFREQANAAGTKLSTWGQKAQGQ
jgi:hypothetical protein